MTRRMARRNFLFSSRLLGLALAWREREKLSGSREAGEVTSQFFIMNAGNLPSPLTSPRENHRQSPQKLLPFNEATSRVNENKNIP
jgi:hypothetical protein